MPKADERPPVWIGHMFLAATDIEKTSTFMRKLGMRDIFKSENVVVLELRGGTHLVLEPGLCLAAHGRHPAAQQRLGHVYAYGGLGNLIDADINRVEAYKWRSLGLNVQAMQQSERVTAMEALAAQMTPDQLAEAERLVQEWKPDPASCEALAGS